MNRLVSAALSGAAAIAVCAVFVAARQPAEDGAPGATFVEPERTALTPVDPPAPPAVPAAADEAPPVSFTLVTTFRDDAGRQRTVEQRAARGRGRVSLIVDAGRREWYFEQNPIHRDRVSGWLVDHDAREILAYQESDLRTALHLRGWLDVLTMRVDLGGLAALTPTGETREVAGHVFRRLRPSAPPAMGVIEIWWSPELLLPLELVTRESTVLETTARVIGLSQQIEAAALRAPQLRFPDYRVLDQADAGEHR